MPSRTELIQAGAKMRQIRRDAQMTGREVEAKTERMGRAVRQSQISRIERGQVAHAPAEDLAMLANVYGWDAAAVLRMFGVPIEGTDDAAIDARLKRAHLVAMSLPEHQRERLLSWIDFAVTQALAEKVS